MIHKPIPIPVSRRDGLKALGGGLGMVAFANMLGGVLNADPLRSSANPWAPKTPHFPARAKNVIYIFLRGGLSHVDSFDRKPVLDKYDGKPLPFEAPRTEFTTGNLMKSPFKFQKYGQNGVEVSEIFPHIGNSIDEFCMIRSMITDIPNHGPAITQMYTGFPRGGRPSLGSWVMYGLGTENQNLPGFVSLAAGGGSGEGVSSGFLPATYQGASVPMNEEDPQKQIQYLSNSKLSLEEQKRQLTLWKSMTQSYVNQMQSSPELEATIQSMEIAFRMQTEAPRVLDTRQESAATLKAYGEGDFAHGCIMARRLVEAGVRIVQVYHANWDHHTDIMGHKDLAREVDQPIAALVEDLKQRGLHKETLLVVTTEFGRTPVLNVGGFQAVANGRDHNPYGFTVLLSGGGMKPGTIYGATDDFGFKAVENICHVNDLHATLLYTLGIDHERLTYRYGGRDFRLTDVKGKVVKDILS
jgi:hypothetical protein